MKLPALLAALVISGSLVAAEVPRSERGQLVLEDIPDVPDRINRRLSRYLETRSAYLADFTRRGELLVTTRFANTSQFHLVNQPMGARKQISFFSEPVFGGTVAPAYFPLIVFVLGAVISLSTGSSYGTFAILMAIAIPVGFELGASMYLTIAAVLSGGLFGDHVSPISDTTVLASVGADCSHISHVITQGAYAGLTGLVTIFAYLMAGIYETPLVLFIAIVVLVVSMPLMMRFFGEEVAPLPDAERSS